MPGTRARGSAGLAAASFLVLSAGAASARTGDEGGASPGRRVEFNRDVRPLLSQYCSACHGPDKGKRKADLRLDVREVALGVGAFVPGKPDESELVRRVYSDDPEEVMPPPSTNKRLSAEQKETLRRWIAEGAEYQLHWSYLRPERPELPAVREAGWVRNPIDAFVLHGLEERGIAPSPEADKRTLLRRLSLDLIGLPPTPEEARAFLADDDPQAYERQVDRLLASPHYGERMALGWLDLARFADTVGYHGDQNVNVVPYRDWVIAACNVNERFERFTIEQLAGDLLPDPTPAQLVATAFNRLNMVTREGGAQPGEYLAKYAADRVRTVATTWLGSTMGCCECHDHKFDPFSTREFYQLAAFFADLKQWGVYQDYDYTPNPDLRGWSNDHPFPPEIEVESPFLERRAAALRREIDATAASAAARAGGLDAWARASARFLRQHPEGWCVPRPALDAGTGPPAPGAAAEPGPAVQEDASVLITGKPSRLELRLPLSIGALAAVRIELLPHEQHGGGILRGGAAGSSWVTLAARL